MSSLASKVSIPNFLMGMSANIPAGASKAFCNLIKAIGEAGSNHEEDRIIRAEVQTLQQKLKEPNIPPKQMKEYLVRLIYCEMLGHEVSFGYIHGVKFAQQLNTPEKRIGYLAVSLMLHENHELILLLVNTIQRDLKSSNVVEVCMALTAVARLISADLIPAVLPMIEDKLTNSREIVRKKAVIALHRCYSRSPQSISHLNEAIRRALCDQDPGVMSAALNLFHDMATADAGSYKDLTPSFVCILKQIIENRLPRDFDYHKVPAPWVQIKLLRVLSLLGADDQTSSEGMYEVIRDTLHRSDIASTAAYAVMYEAICTVTKIYPSAQLVELAARCVGRFLKSENNNLKYLGITALALIVQVNPAYAADHQMIVIDCLDDPDETIKRKTLDLLCKMTNPANVTVITDRLVAYLSSSVDNYLRKDLVPRIIQLAERFAPDSMWYIEVMNKLFSIAGDLIQPEVAHNLMRLIAEGSEDDDADRELRVYAAESFIDMLEQPFLPDLLAQTACWVVGEYSYLSEDIDQAIVLDIVAALMSRTFANDLETKGWILSALMKLVAQTGLYPPSVSEVVNQYATSVNVDVQQRAIELSGLVQKIALMRQIFPKDASCEDIEVDAKLGFLNGYVQGALQAGHKPYVKRDRRSVQQQQHAAEQSRSAAAFNFTPYERQVAPPPSQFTAPPAHSVLPSAADQYQSSQASSQGQSFQGQQQQQQQQQQQAQQSSASQSVVPQSVSLNVTVKRWGKSGDQARESSGPHVPSGPPVGSGSALPSGPAVSVEEAPPARTPDHVGSYNSSPVLPRANFQPAPEPARPEDARKQQLASALFAMPAAAPAARTVKPSRAKKSAATGGSVLGSSAPAEASLLGDVAPSYPPQQSTSVYQQPPQHQQSAPQAGGGDLMGDFLGLNISAAPAPVQPAYPPQQLMQPQYQPQPQSGLGDLLSMGAPAPVPTHAPVVQQSLLGGPLMGGPLQPTAFGNSAAGAGAGASLLDLMGDAPAAAAAAAPMAAAPMPAMMNFGAPMDTGFPASLSQFPHSAPPAEITNDACLSISYSKVWRNDALLLVLYYRNKDNRMLNGVVTRLDISPNILRRATPGLDDLAGADSLVDNLPPQSSARHVLTLTANSLATVMSFKGQAVYTDASMTARTVYFSVPINASDFLREIALTTEQFGGYWEGLTSERKQRVANSTVKSMDDLCRRVSQDLHIRVVQVIGQEVICAGQLPAEPPAVCLVHCKISHNAVDLSVRSASVQFSEGVVRQAAICFK